MTKIKLNLKIFFYIFSWFFNCFNYIISTSSILDYGHGVDSRYSRHENLSMRIITSSQDGEGKEYKVLSGHSELKWTRCTVRWQYRRVSSDLVGVGVGVSNFLRFSVDTINICQQNSSIYHYLTFFSWNRCNFKITVSWSLFRCKIKYLHKNVCCFNRYHTMKSRICQLCVLLFI